ncbi:BTAD domain-containing putative transcriptional regulator [Micromonospora yangpuensis]|uniref:Transcriptional regulatory protein, C terminal n=1 Tax=Micromonospora yangpuensis TaxID=683228 RepID=A0A1C6ULG7_9ACTN|nr:BTAD domain-containing putative transcriptional regulator [Micromonospora yangpuensis]SCL54713.1 Transcriptional regulatory protein, C terminal [Micromonospora yangpuensis]
MSPGPRQQAYLLGLLLARAGQPVSTTELIDLVWGDDAPTTAVNVIHKYVGALRRVLEPTLAPRAEGSYLHRHGTGYRMTTSAGMLDLSTFREQVAAARTHLTKGRHQAALDAYVRALALWRGPAGDGYAPAPAAVALFAALDGEFLDAGVAAAELAVPLGQPQRVLPALRLAATMAPLHEPVQAQLVTALSAAGQQAQALTVFRAVRADLAEHLGVDPGPALRTAHRRALERAGTPPAPPVPPVPQPLAGGGLVGRTGELATLRQATAVAFAGGTALVLVQGEPGIGKTRLLREATVEAEQRGALVVWGHCLDDGGSPSMWLWVQAIRAVLDGLPAEVREKPVGRELGSLLEPRRDVLAAPVLPDNGFQFRLFEQVVAIVAAASAGRPVVLALDDLQWGDSASLRLISHLTARLPQRTTVIGALRDRAPAPGSELSRMLAAVSRVPGHQRIRLGNLDEAEVAELIRRETGTAPTPDATRGILTRTAGNPFFVRELSRLLTDRPRGRDGVPATVRDVVIDRMAGLDDDARDLLRIAALIGRDVDLGLLARAAGLDLDSCLERLEPVEALGMLETRPHDPIALRFTHDLVREAVAATTRPAHVGQLHLRIADALRQVGSDAETVAERLAHHLWSAGPLAAPAPTARALIQAGRHAAGKSALDVAERSLRSAVQVARGAGLAELELSALAQLTAVLGMRSMYGFSVTDLLERAEHLARGLGLQREAASFLYSRWVALVQAIELDRSAPLARRLLKRGEASGDPWVLACGLHAWGLQQWDYGQIGEAIRYLDRSRPMIFDIPRREEDPVRHDLQLLMAAMLAEVATLHGDVADGRALLDEIEDLAGEDPYMVTVWACAATRISVIAGDPVLALRASGRGIAVDPGFSFVFLGTYQRLARCWALAVTGQDPIGNAERARQIIAMHLLDPPRSDVAAWHGLLGEMLIAGGALDAAATALDEADFYLDSCGQRHPEGLLLLLRARLLQARGEPVEVVAAAAEHARAVSAEREAFLHARRAERLLDELVLITRRQT